jgi:hypothetical protein
MTVNQHEWAREHLRGLIQQFDEGRRWLWLWPWTLYMCLEVLHSVG